MRLHAVIWAVGALALVGCAHPEREPEQPSNMVMVEEEIAILETEPQPAVRVDDGQLARAVEDALGDASDLDSGDIDVQVKDGYVSLEGEVENRRDMARAVQIARSIPGVRRVFVDELDIE